ncbi:MAG: ABC transporter permease [Fulvivirga sp.]|uniref:ABC transporter permease n=1 Tax=Fulvivirga sp. TaxID=1931237 RepID=UPI0032ECC703
MKHQPPIWADRFLEWYCNPLLLEDIQGDLHELYNEHANHKGVFLANIIFCWHVIRSFRLSTISIDNNKNSKFMMTKNNLKVAFRVLGRNKLNTFLNLSGLAIGITCFLLLGFFVKQELSYDQFHSKKDRIYRAWVKEVYGEDKVFFNSVTPFIFKPVLEENFEEFEHVVQINRINLLMGEVNNRFNENAAAISPEFFEVFDFTIVRGNKEKPLEDKSQVILSESMAQKYFGLDDPIGKVLPIQIGEEFRDFTVAAIIADMPQESSIQFDIALSGLINVELFGQNQMDAWFSVTPETYVLVREQNTIASVEAALPEVIMSYLKEEVDDGVYNIGFQPLTDIHLNPEIPAGIAPVGNPTYVYILAAIGLVVLVVALINYTTLSIGQSIKRSKEVGVRKVMGAAKNSLVNQYLTESLIISALAVIIGLVLTYALLPFFNKLTGADVIWQFEFWHILVYLSLIAFVGLASGFYPALILSRLNTITSLKGNEKVKRNSFLRNSMVIFQFVVTVFLISSTLIMSRQLNYMQTKDVGYNYEATVAVPLYADPNARRISELISTAMEKGTMLKSKLETYSSITDVSMGSHVFGSQGWGQVGYTADDGTFRQLRFVAVDDNYLNTFKIPLIEGRNFEKNSDADKRQAMILNKAAVDYLGIENPVGNRLPGSKFGDHIIIGVTENFNYSSLHTEVEPLVITQNIEPLYAAISDHNFNDSPVPKLIFRYKGASLANVKGVLEKEWKATFPEEELNFSFVEDNMQAMYESEIQMNRLVLVSTGLAIIIASLGLLGLTILVSNSRIKEIGIRKIVGASLISLFGTLAKGFIPQLVAGIVLSIPITYWLMSTWLSDFAFRIEIGIGTFLISGILSIVIALFVISYHTLKAAMVNPVETLRVE